ncbi:hypothetical protein CIT14_22270, partial [Virgibacillus profundi]
QPVWQRTAVVTGTARHHRVLGVADPHCHRHGHRGRAQLLPAGAADRAVGTATAGSASPAVRAGHRDHRDHRSRPAGAGTYAGLITSTVARGRVVPEPGGRPWVTATQETPSVTGRWHARRERGARRR